MGTCIDYVRMVRLVDDARGRPAFEIAFLYFYCLCVVALGLHHTHVVVRLVIRFV
jgi:hypothetical protein